MDTLALTSLFIGDTVEKNLTVSGYLPSEWTLKYEIAGATPLVFSDDGVNFILSTILTGITTGEYNYRVTATNRATPTKIKTLLTGRVRIIDLAYKSHARKVLDAIEATIEGTASVAQSEMTINGRSIKYQSPEQLLILRTKYKREVANEEAQDRIGSGLGNKNKIMVRF